MNGAPRSTLRLVLLGGFELIGPRGPIDVGSRKACALVTILACDRAKSQTRDMLATLLWGSHFDGQARQNLRQTLTKLRRVLGDEVLVSYGDAVAIKSDALTCDAREFEDRCAQGTLEALATAVDLYKGQFARDISIKEDGWTEWVSKIRRRLDKLAAEAMTLVGERELVF